MTNDDLKNICAKYPYKEELNCCDSDGLYKELEEKFPGSSAIMKRIDNNIEILNTKGISACCFCVDDFVEEYNNLKKD